LLVNINLQELLTTVGAGGVIVWAMAWLLKQVISTELGVNFAIRGAQLLDYSDSGLN
jgi:hypothetical protein